MPFDLADGTGRSHVYGNEPYSRKSKSFLADIFSASAMSGKVSREIASDLFRKRQIFLRIF